MKLTFSLMVHMSHTTLDLLTSLKGHKHIHAAYDKQIKYFIISNIKWPRWFPFQSALPVSSVQLFLLHAVYNPDESTGAAELKGAVVFQIQSAETKELIALVNLMGEGGS